MDRMKVATKPLFTDVTWGAGGSTADLSLRIAQEAHKTGHCGKMIELSLFFAYLAIKISTPLR